MDLFSKLPLLIIITSVVCHALPIVNKVVEKHSGPRVNIAEKHGGPWLLDPKCKIRYETKLEVQEVDDVRKECSEWTE